MSDPGGPYEAVYPAPTGEATVSRFAATAARSGFRGVVVRAPPEELDLPNGTGWEEYAAAVADAHGVDVVRAVEITADTPAEARGHLGRVREEYSVVVVRGGTPALNRFAVEAPRVDVLAAPMRDEGDLNHVLARAAADNRVHLELRLDPVLRSRGGRRVRALRELRKLRELADAYDAPTVASGAPRSHLGLRAPRELVAVGEAIGFSAGTVRDGLAAWGRIATRNRERRSSAYVQPGVRVRDCSAGADGGSGGAGNARDTRDADGGDRP